MLQVHEPVLFLSGQMDEMVPPAHMQRLYDATRANTACKFFEFPTGMHMDTWLKGGERYWRILQIYLEQHASGAQSRSEVSTITSEDSLSEL